VYGFTRDEIDLEAIRHRIARMTNEQLERYGSACDFDGVPELAGAWRVQLDEVRKEWRQRCQSAG